MFLLIIYIICYNYYFNNKSWCIIPRNRWKICSNSSLYWWRL